MARDFDGVDDIINCGSAAVLDDLANWTHCCWFRPDTTGEAGFGTMMRKNANDAALGKVFHVEATGSFRGAARRATTNLSLEASDNTITLGQWVFGAFTYDGTTGKLFKGSPGGAVAETSYKVNTQGAGALTSDSNGVLTIGNDITGATTFDGRIAYCRWFNAALTADELTAVMYNRPARPSALVFFMPLIGASPEPDWSGNGSNGTVTGAVVADGPPVPPPYLGDEDFLAWVVSAGSGVSGTIAVTLANFTSAISGSRTVRGTIAQTLADFTSAISGSKTIRGTIAQTLANFTSAIAGAKSHVGTMAATLADLTSAITGSKSHVGTMSATLDAFTSAISGTAGGAVAAGRWLVRQIGNKVKFACHYLATAARRNRNNG